jgi:hypothetical protein
MAKSDVEKLTEEKVSKGGVLVKLYFDMQHKEKERLQPLMVDLINERLMKEKGVVYCVGEIDEPMEIDGIYITSAVVTALFESFMPLVRIAFHYAPAGIEIIKPTHDISFKTFDLQSMLMDISQIALDYSKYMVENMLKSDEKDKLMKAIDNRYEIGRRHMEKKEQEKKE